MLAAWERLMGASVPIFMILLCSGMFTCVCYIMCKCCRGATFTHSHIDRRLALTHIQRQISIDTSRNEWPSPTSISTTACSSDHPILLPVAGVFSFFWVACPLACPLALCRYAEMPIHRLTIHELLSTGSQITNERLVSMAQHVQVSQHN